MCLFHEGVVSIHASSKRNIEALMFFASTYFLLHHLCQNACRNPEEGKKLSNASRALYVTDFWSYEARAPSPDLLHPCRTQTHLDTFSTLENVYKYLIVFFLSWTRFGHAPTRTGYLHVLGYNIIFNT